MKDKLMFRTLEKEDYKTICAWWKRWEWPILPKEMLPDNGECGFIVEKNGEPIVSAFLYLTNSTGAIELLLGGAEKFCKGLGVTYIFSIGRNKNLMKTHEKLGWHVDKKPSHEIIKNI